MELKIKAMMINFKQNNMNRMRQVQKILVIHLRSKIKKMLQQSKYTQMKKVHTLIIF